MNKQKIINQVLRAIKTYPTTINLKRSSKVDDGLGGYEDKEIDVATFDGFVNESGSSVNVPVINEGGRLQKVNRITLIAVCSDEFKIEVGDYFEAKGKSYRIVYPNNLFDICYICDLEVII